MLLSRRRSSREPRPEPPSPTLTEDDVAQLVTGIATTHRIAPPPILWGDGYYARMTAHRHHPRLLLGRDVRTDRQEAGFLVAHEMGHLVLGHCTRRAVARNLLIYLAGLVVVFGVTLGAAWGLAGPSAPSTFALPAILPWILAQRTLLIRLKQPAERAADAFAGRCGEPLTAELASTYTARETPAERVLRWIFPTHPPWSDRVSDRQTH